MRGTLAPDARLAVDDYLRSHPELRRQVEEWRAAHRGAAARPAPLPQSTAAQAMPRTSRASTAPASSHQAAAPQRAPATRGERLSAWWQGRGVLDLTLVGSTVAALLLAVALGWTALRLDGIQRQVQTVQEQIAALQADNAALLGENVRLQQEVRTQQDQWALLATATELVPLAGTEAAPGAAAALYARGGQATLLLNNLEMLASDQTYQLWLIPAEGAPRPAGLLGAGGAPVQTVSLALPGAVDEFAALAVSIEPSAGSPAPIGPIVLVGPIP